jgi:uncharacterized protein YndB with AHSA1/START domain
MKLALKYILIGVVVVALSFIGMGLLHPTIEYESRIEINAAVDKSFQLFNDTALMKKWMPGFLSLTKISGDANEVGSQWKLVLKQKEDVFEMMETVTAFETNKRFAFNLDNDVMTGTTEVLFDGDSLQTVLLAKSTAKGKNFLMRSVFSFSKPYFKQQQDDIYLQLKNTIENSR